MEGNQVDLAHARAIVSGHNGIALSSQKLLSLGFALLSKRFSFVSKGRATDRHTSRVTEKRGSYQGRGASHPSPSPPKSMPSACVEYTGAVCHTEPSFLTRYRTMRIRPEEVQHIAQLARLTLTAEEEADLVEHFDKVLTYIEKLEELNTDEVEPMVHAVEVPTPLRDDRVTNQANTNALLQNAPDRQADFFKVPKIIE